MSPLLFNAQFMITKEQVETAVEEILKGTDKFLIEATIQPGNHIVVYVDGDSNVSIADCRDLSRLLEKRLNLDYSDHRLTVSSAGMDRPLKLLRQYRKRIGREMEVITQDGTRTTGILTRADENGIELEHPVKNPKKEIQKPDSHIAMDRIRSAKIIITFGK